jgi:hypothetical protein
MRDFWQSFRHDGDLTLNPGAVDADRATMRLTTPRAQVFVVLMLTAAMAVLMLVRLGYGERPVAAPTSITPVSLERHTPGSAAHDRRAYRYRLEVAPGSSAR